MFHHNVWSVVTARKFPPAKRDVISVVSEQQKVSRSTAQLQYNCLRWSQSWYKYITTWSTLYDTRYSTLARSNL